MKRWLTQRLMTRSRRQLAAVVTLLLVLATFLALALHAATRPEAREKAWYNLPAPCRLPDSTLDSLAALAFSMHAALQSLHVPHVLCYGTLWGALRKGRILPWDTNIDMCAMDLHFANVSAIQLQEAFGKRGVELLYDWRRGQYNVSFRGGAVQGCISVFTRAASSLSSSDDPRGAEETAVPAGWNRAVWRWFGQKQTSFPLWLLQAPFQTVKFHEKDFPVPHEGLELLKYLYPSDWWQEVKPPGCP